MDKPISNYKTLYQVRLALQDPRLPKYETSAEIKLRNLVLIEMDFLEQRLYPMLDESYEGNPGDYIKDNYKRLEQFFNAYNHVFFINHHKDVLDFIKSLDSREKG